MSGAVPSSAMTCVCANAGSGMASIRTNAESVRTRRFMSGIVPSCASMQLAILGWDRVPKSWRMACTMVPNVLFLWLFARDRVKTLTRLSMKRNPDESLSRLTEMPSRPSLPPGRAARRKRHRYCSERSGDDVRAERPAETFLPVYSRVIFCAGIQENRDKHDSLCASRRRSAPQCIRHERSQ